MPPRHPKCRVCHSASCKCRSKARRVPQNNPRVENAGNQTPGTSTASSGMQLQNPTPGTSTASSGMQLLNPTPGTSTASSGMQLQNPTPGNATNIPYSHYPVYQRFYYPQPVPPHNFYHQANMYSPFYNIPAVFHQSVPPQNHYWVPLHCEFSNWQAVPAGPYPHQGQRSSPPANNNSIIRHSAEQQASRSIWDQIGETIVSFWLEDDLFTHESCHNPLCTQAIDTNLRRAQEPNIRLEPQKRGLGNQRPLFPGRPEFSTHGAGIWSVGNIPECRRVEDESRRLEHNFSKHRGQQTKPAKPMRILHRSTQTTLNPLAQPFSVVRPISDPQNNSSEGGHTDGDSENEDTVGENLCSGGEQNPGTSITAEYQRIFNDWDSNWFSRENTAQPSTGLNEMEVVNASTSQEAVINAELQDPEHTNKSYAEIAKSGTK